MIEIKGKEGIVARVIQDSVSQDNKRITTFELEYPRYVHAELMTHRLFSRNAASSRAIPVTAMHKHIEDNTATPVTWQKNQAGMQSSVDIVGEELAEVKRLWVKARDAALASAKELFDAGLHKQWANRPTEAFQMMKTVVTATEWDNWYWLRNHTDAQPDIHELALCMFEAQKQSTPQLLFWEEWHVPYVTRIVEEGSPLQYFVGGQEITAEEAIIVSASCCAQVSYRKSDDTLDKAKMIYDKLINSEPVHASPVEHQATPMRFAKVTEGVEWEEGVTHLNKDGTYASGNFKGWIQYRQLIPNNVK